MSARVCSSSPLLRMVLAAKVFRPEKLKSSPGRSVIGRGRQSGLRCPGRHFRQHRPAGIIQSQQLRRLIKGFARRIVNRLAQQFILTNTGDANQLRGRRKPAARRTGTPADYLPASAPADALPYGVPGSPARSSEGQRRPTVALTSSAPTSPTRRIGDGVDIFRRQTGFFFSAARSAAPFCARGRAMPAPAPRRRNRMQFHLTIQLVG